MKVINYPFIYVYVSGFRKSKFGWLISYEDGSYAGVSEFVPQKEKMTLYKFLDQLKIREDKNFIYWRTSIMQRLDDEVLLQRIKDKFLELNRAPSRREVYGNATILTRFGTWNNALEKAGLSPNKVYKYGDKKSIKETVEKELKRLHTTNKYVYEEHKKSSSPSYHTVVRHFNGWGAFLKSIDLD